MKPTTDRHAVGVDLARELIETQFPEVAPALVTYLGEGSDSTAFDVNALWVFRFPKRDYAEEQLLVETGLLPLLSDSLPVAVPRFRFHGQPSRLFPYHFAGYPKLLGVTALQSDSAGTRFKLIAPVMSQFLSILHTFPLTRARKLGVRTEPIQSVMEEKTAEALDRFKFLEVAAPLAPLERWYAYFKAGAGPSSERQSALLHNDLAAEHVLLDPVTHQISGVLDWGDLAIGDPVTDFAGLFHWGGQPFVRSILSTYTGAVDDALLPRARYLAACKSLGDVVMGLEEGQPESIATALHAIELAAES